MFGVAAFVATISCSCIPESPYWLLERGDDVRAALAFKSLYSKKGRTSAIQARMKEYKSRPKSKQVRFSVFKIFHITCVRNLRSLAIALRRFVILLKTSQP